MALPGVALRDEQPAGSGQPANRGERPRQIRDRAPGQLHHSLVASRRESAARDGQAGIDHGPGGRARGDLAAHQQPNTRVYLLTMPRWIGLLGSWALFVLALGLASFAAAGEWINLRDKRRIQRVALIDQMLRERSGNKAEVLRTQQQQRAAEVNALQSRVDTATKQTDDVP